MGFMDKAKKMAEQAQAKLDEAQKQFNAGQQSGEQSSGPAVEYDSHGRPIQQAPATPPHGDPLAEASVPSPPGAPPAPPIAQPAPPVAQPPATPPPVAADAAAPEAPPARPEPDAADEDRNHPSYAPPKLSSGDPLAG
jgi:hypothetical protein